MRILIAGLGSIGRRHLRNVRALLPEADITVLRHAFFDEAVLPDADRYVFSLEDALRHRPDAALICGPASTHVPVATALARERVHLFVEKPISDTSEGVPNLIALCEGLGLTLMIGYNLRFLPSLRAMRDALLGGTIGRLMTVDAEAGQYLPEWRPDVDYRGTVSASRARGGGVTLELSHEIDYVRWLCGEIADVSAVSGTLGDLDVDVEDTTRMLVRFRSGAIGSIRLDMAIRSRARGCRLAGTAGTLAWDGIAGEVRLFSAETRAWSTLDVGDSSDRNASYRAELEHFFACVREGTPPLVTGEDGLRTLEVAVAAKASAASGRSIPVGEGIGVRRA